MRKKILLAITFTVASLVCVTPYVWTSSSGAQSSSTGALPNESTCATTCHTGNALNASGGTMAIRLLDQTTGNEVSAYTPSKIYNVNVTLNKPGAVFYGFELCAKTFKSNIWIHTGTLTKGTGTTFSMGSTKYITHSTPGTGNWTFQWTAPSTPDNVTFYAAGNAANANGQTSGDYIYTTSKTIPASTVSISENNSFASNVTIKQNPVTEYLVVDFEQSKPEQASISRCR